MLHCGLFYMVLLKILINWGRQSFYKPIPFTINLLTWYSFYQTTLWILENCQLHCKSMLPKILFFSWNLEIYHYSQYCQLLPWSGRFISLTFETISVKCVWIITLCLSLMCSRKNFSIETHNEACMSALCKWFTWDNQVPSRDFYSFFPFTQM